MDLDLSQNVIVLAKSFEPSEAQKQLLNKGLTFVPTIGLYKDQKAQLQLDIQNYHRRLKLAAYFGDSSGQEQMPFMPTTIWTPPPDKLPEEINRLVVRDKKDFKTHFKFHTEKLNLTTEEVKALRELQRDKDIVIKPADKGSTVVIQGRDQYILEANRQLSNPTYYKKLEGPIYLETAPVVYQIVDTLYKKKFINAKQKQYLKGDTTPRERRFYTLPKIHKDPNGWTLPFEVPPGRPIVSDCNSETYRTAEYIDYYLNPLSVKHPSYVKDTYHFIETIRGLKIPPNSLFFTIDIDSLYTNIETKSGLSAVRKIFQTYQDDSRPDEELLQLLEINLTRNDFEFNGEYYLQVKGTAMGKKFAPAYANIFMANWEEGALAKCQVKPLYFLRYLDDIWGIWTDSDEEFERFIHILDTHDSSIRLKYTSDYQSIDFLDTTVYKGPAHRQGHTLDVKVYFKETDTHALLFKTSFHPKHTFRGLIKSQLLRFDRICTQRTDFWEAVKVLFRALRKRGYSRSFLRNCLKSYRVQKQKDQKGLIPLITQFSKVSTDFNHRMKNNYKAIIEDRGLLQNYRIISAYRKNRSLKDLLVRAKLRPMQGSKNKSVPDYFCNLKYVRNLRRGTIFKLSQVFTPQTTNCVYVLFCSKCGKQYIGQTKNSIATRMWQHRYNIKHNRGTEKPMVKHFVSHGLQSVRVSGIQGNALWTDYERRKFERIWIQRLDSKEPFGLNNKS